MNTFMNKKNSYDIIIIGSGIAGLYSAYNIQRLAPNMTFLVLEKYKKNWIGGRLNNEEFYGTTVVTGAGIGRKDKDHLLQALLKELHIEYTDFKLEVNYALLDGEPVDVNKIFQMLKKEYLKSKDGTSKNGTSLRKTFKQFAKPLLGSKLYDQFIETTGYSDYENEDISQTLYKYGMDDNTGGLNGLYIPWKKLIQTLVYKIGTQFIRASNNVTSILPNSSNETLKKYVLETDKGITYYCDKVILATTITGIQKLLPQILNKTQYSLYNYIKGQPFLRLYAKFPKASADIMRQYVPTYTIVSGPLQKIIPMSKEKGVYMIAYSDNANAEVLKDHLDNNAKNRLFFAQLLEETLKIPPNTLQITSLLDFYWPIGTHYYTPLPKGMTVNEYIHDVQHPLQDILVVGEVVAENQGWTEGALDSVAKALTKKWLFLNK
jgi:protoporphyrinogen oxidase